VEVYDAANLNTILAKVFQFKSLSFNTPESDIGYGTVTWSYDDPILSSPLPNGLPLRDLLGRPNYWRVFDNGVERFRFIHDGTVRQVVADDGSQELVISGPDPTVFLEWATVLPSAYPADFAATPRTFTGVPWATVWLTLLNEAKARGVVPAWITPTFTATHDSNLDPWGDTGTYAIPPGGNLLDLLRQMQDNAGFKWQVRYSGVMVAAPEFGANKASTVRFFEGHDVLVSNIQEERKDVRNDVYLQGGDGLISRAVDTDSVVAWFRREAYVTVQEAQDATTRNTAVNTHLAITKQPVRAFTFQVDPFPVNDAGESIGRRVFVDYVLGDTIGYGPRATDGSQDYRLVDLAVEVDEESAVTLEITVESRLERSIDRMRRLLRLALGGNYNPSSGGSGITAQVIGTIAARLQDLYLDDLADVTTASAANGQALVFNLGTGMWEPGDAGSSVYVDPSPPPTYDSGDLWYDTDEPQPSGGGGGSTVKDRRWVRGSTAHAQDDEFNDDSLSASWIAVHGNGSSGNVTWTEGGDSLTARMTGGDGNGSPNQYLHCQLKAYSLAVGESIQTYLAASNPALQYPIQGLIVSDSGTDGSGTQYLWGTVWDLSNERLGHSVGANFRTRTSFTDITGRWFSGIHMRMTRSATLTYDLYTSADAVSWGSKFATLTAGSGYTPTHVGVWCSGLVFGSGAAEVGFDYFRVV
jgi:hypothetical protein